MGAGALSCIGSDLKAYGAPYSMQIYQHLWQLLMTEQICRSLAGAIQCWSL